MPANWRGLGTSPVPPVSQPTPGAPPGNAGMSATPPDWLKGIAQNHPNYFPGVQAKDQLQNRQMNTIGPMGAPVRPGPQGAPSGFQPPAVDKGTPGAGFEPPQAPPGEGFGPGFGETYGKEHIGFYDKPTMLETFAQQQMDGNNPYFDRLRSEQAARINQQAASRGHFNSGGAMSALGNADAALTAAQFADMGNLLGSASNMAMNRTGQGFNQASSIQNLQRDRLGQQFNQLSDIAHLGAGLVGGFTTTGGQLSGDAAMTGLNAGVNGDQLDAQGTQAGQNFVWDAVKGMFVPG